MSALLQITGFIMCLPSVMWLAGRLIEQHGMTRLQAISVFLPTALIGLILIWCGGKLRSRPS